MKYDISKIRSLIAKTGMNETDFLHSVGLGSKTLTRWECGSEHPREDYVSFISQKLGVQKTDLIFDETKKPLTPKQPSPSGAASKQEKTVDLKYIPPNELRKMSLETRRKLYDTYPNKLFKPTGTAYYERIPKTCPYDNEPLRKLKLSNRKQKGGNRKWCCLACFRKFLPKDEQPNMILEQHAGVANYRDSSHTPKGSGLSSVSIHSSVPRPKNTLQSNNFNDVILTAILCRVGVDDPFNLTIVTNEHKQDSTKNIYWVGRALPSAVLAAIQTKDRQLLHKGVKYQVVDFVTYKDAEKYLRIISRFSNPTAPQTVYVFSQKNIAHFSQDRYELVTAMIPCADRIYPVPVNVYYDKAKQQYFINEATYSNLRKHYGLPYMRLQVATGQGASQWFSTLKPRSELNLLGYNVSAVDGLSIDSRRKILRDAIDSGVLWKGEIINHLEWLIKTMGNHPNMENAVGEWRSDLLYISKYQATEQRKIWVAKFKSRFSETTSF